ncbi:MAG: OmpH family outer membrane protein [Deferribacterota bacterium]|nr:OmpH family outer membrane protein [Deferribacterota bacterium]
MKRIFLTSMLIIFAITVIPLHADVKVGVANLQRALDESEAGKQAVEKMKEFFQEKQKEINRRKAELAQLKEEITNQSSLLTEEAKKDKMSTYQDRMKELQRFIQDSNEEMRKKESEYVSKIARELRDVVKELGRELGYDLIIEADQGGVLYNSNMVDITGKVIERYNRKWKAKD